MALTVTENLRRLGPARAGTPAPVFGYLEQCGEVQATFYRLPPRGLSVTILTPEQAEILVARLTSFGHSLPSVSAEHHTAAAFAEAWRRQTGVKLNLRAQLRLHRLGVLAPPEPAPVGRGRLAGERDHEHILGWCREFAADVGEAVTINADSWSGSRFAEKRYTFWLAPDGTPVSMAGVTPMVAGQVRVDPVYTPADLRGHGYAAAVTVEVSRAALAAGATDVVLFTNAANPTSNALYRRIGYVPIADWATYDFTPTEPNAS
ncbi:GNAT family N-acetyltransferase [Actinoplanes philippinensis]|uniref:GNAT family N-acetyltransferase n=1 Tax=Actinoplanes philippinensis TaxID=35752 RepID=UPI0033E3B4A9